MLFATVAFATINSYAASTGTLLLQGTVPSVNDIAITPDPNATALNITGGETDKLVAAVSESSNSLSGYHIEMSSMNAGQLRHTSDMTKQTAYTVSYDGGSAVALTAVPQTVKNVASLPGLTTVSSNVNANVVAFPSAPNGTYQDTVTIAIVAN